MSKTLLMNFVTDKENKQIRVDREFNAPRNLVWKAWTTADILEQWWAPKPWKAVTGEMRFEEGGHWHYYMQGPEGEKHYCTADYKKITAPQTLTYQDAFCDEHYQINDAHPRMNWTNEFEGVGDATVVHIVIQFDKLEDLETIIQMGFKEGFTMGLGNLDEWLAEHK